jgi:hypothetical protein
MSWTKDVIAINPRGRVTVETVGRGRHRVVLVDDFYQHPEQVLELANSLSYVGGKMHGNFPGTRAIVSLDTGPTIAKISQLWGAALEPAQLFQPVVFSAIQNDGATRLNVAQRMPHVDPGVSAMIYLNRDAECSGGTGLYRHTLTGLERLPIAATNEMRRLAELCDIDPRNLETPQGYTSFQDQIIFNPLFAVQENSYINDGNPFWELLYKIEMKFNRLVVFDGRMFHSQHLDMTRFRDATRLNQILYLKARE